MFTPNDLRKLSIEANGGFEDRKSQERALRIEHGVQSGIALFERDAAEQSRKGLREAVACEYEDQSHKTKAFDQIPDESREIFIRLMGHFENLGFKTRIHGPFVSGGPSHTYTGFDLMVQW